MPDSMILVPLDGSPMAEAALPYAETLAEITGAGLRLLSVVAREPRGLTNRSERVAGELEQAGRDAAERYLAEIAAVPRERGLTVATVVEVGDAAAAIMAAAGAGDVALIVMATSGAGGVDRWILGSVADRVMRQASRPTLLVRPPYTALPRRVVQVQRIMVPLDGSPSAEAALRPAVDLATATGAALVLVTVEPWVTLGRAPDAAMPSLKEVEQRAAEAAAAYLDRVRVTLPAGLPCEVVVLRGRPAEALVDFALHERIDLVVMTTHGRGGLRRMALGSVAERVVRSGVPALLVRQQARPPVPAPAAAAAAGLTAGEIMSGPPITVREQTTLEEVARTMIDRGVSSVLVVDAAGALRGIITESDFTGKERCLPFSAFKAPHLFGEWVSKQGVEEVYRAARGMIAREIMSAPVITATEQDAVTDVVARLVHHDIHRLPVVRDGKPVGVVTRHDLLRLMVDAGAAGPA
ncbi:MAG: universal stress protein [Dehalococcoidia bacterium]